MNPSILPNYIENYQGKVNKNIINKKITLLIDSSFQLIGLDYTDDISKFAGDYGSFAILNTNNQLLNDWLLVLEKNKDVDIEKDLKSISEFTISDQNVNSTNKLNTSESNLISKKINSSQSIYFSNEKEHILISSNPKIIQSSILNFKNDKLNTKETYHNIQLKNKVSDGILLLEMSPKKVFNILGQEEDLLAINETDNLISSINLDNKKLVLEGILAYDIKSKRPINDPSYNLIDIEKELNLFDNSILINNPKKYFEKNPINPYQKSIASIIQQSITLDSSKLLKIILENTKGNIILINDKNWLAITKKSNIDKEKINDILIKEKFSNSNLKFTNKNLEVWSKITTNINEKDEIKENIEAIIEEKKDEYIWSQDLTSILNFDNQLHLSNNIDDYYPENENNEFDDITRIHLGDKKTEVFLNNFYPYILLKTMIGNKLNFPQNTDISLSIPSINYPDFIKFKIDLKTS
tara:strand:+ start:767 stop:2170 length:1404 start_codon:yes stop_codon:yes gene_type:complete